MPFRGYINAQDGVDRDGEKCKNESDGNRTRNLRIDSPVLPSATNAIDHSYKSSPATPSSTPGNPTENHPSDPDLQRLINAWASLPEPVRAGIVAMVQGFNT